MKPEKDEFMLGLQKELQAMGLKCAYARQVMRSYKPSYSERYIHQLRVSGLVSRCMYVSFDSEKKELHVSDQMWYQYSTKDWQFALVDPASNPQLIMDFFRDLKAVGDKYGRTVPPPPPPAPKVKPTPIALNATAVPFSKILKP